MLPKPFVFLILFILTTACGPLVPLSYVENGPGGQLTQTIETREATIWLQYMESQNGFMVFDLEIANHSQLEVPVAAQQISFYASKKPFIPIQGGDDVHRQSAPNSTLTMNRQFASDPSSIQNFYLKKAKSKKVEAGIFTALAIGFILYDIATDSKAATKETFTSRDEWKAFGRDVMVSAALTAADVSKASAQKTAEESYFLPYELFPECTIESGGNVRGKIFVPLESYHKFVRVVVPLNDGDYVFDFKRRGAKS